MFRLKASIWVIGFLNYNQMCFQFQRLEHESEKVGTLQGENSLISPIGTFTVKKMQPEQK